MERTIEKKDKLSLLTKAVYGSGNFAANLMVCTAGSYLAFYYTDVAGLPIAAVGVILLACKLVDGVTDLCMGMIVEKTRSKHGKARAWLLRMAIPFGLATTLMFFSPDWGPVGKIVFAVATYIAGTALIYTAISVPYNTLSALITDDTDDRTSLATMRQFFGLLGPLVITVITIPVINALGGGQFAWTTLTAVFGAVGTMIYLLVFFATKEKDIDEEILEQKPKKMNATAIGKELRTLFRNKYWLMVLLITLALFTYNSVLAGVMVYYCNYILGDSNMYSLLSMASTIPTIAGCLFVPQLAKKYGKRNISIIGCVIAILGNIVMLFGPANLIVLMAGVFIRGLGMGPLSICVFAMLGDTAVYGEWRTGMRNEGLIFSAQTFAEKVGSAVGGAVASFALAIGGYVANQVIQGSAAITSMKFCMIVIPIILSLVFIVILKFYKLDKEYPKILQDLDTKKY